MEPWMLLILTSWFAVSFIGIIIGIIYKWKTANKVNIRWWLNHCDALFYLFLGGYISLAVILHAIIDDYSVRKEERRIKAPWYLLKEHGGYI